jgi:indoleamine 2,3-dioxygenase
MQQFFGGVDEAWFRLVHVAIEAAAAPAINALQPLQQAAQEVGGVQWCFLYRQLVP